jgi:DNA polymerase-3 subunit alpha
MSSSGSFVHLHTHSDYSTRDSIARIGDLCAAAAADGQPALAITDHGNLGATRLLRETAARYDIKPIYGVEAYLAVEDGQPNARLRHGTTTDDEKKYHHLTILAETPEGWTNLLKIQAAANESYWSKPRADLDLLQEHHDGLIVLTGCLGGPIKQPLSNGDYDTAHANLATLVDIFGHDNTFVEMMSHGIPEEDALNADLERFAKEFGLRTVATNDSHYVHESDHHAHDAWLCISSNSTLDDPTRWRFTGSGYHLRTAEEMRALFDRESVDVTLEIAERCTQYDMMPKSGLRLPTFDPSDPRDSDQILYEMTRDAAPNRYGKPLPAEVRERLRYELDIIAGAHLSDYFLIVADMIHWAKAQGIRVGPGRGSAAGSCVSYVLGITNVDPLAHGLLFERFLNPTRAKMPDIDTDFEQNRREEVIAYLAQRWGDDRVARIGTHGISLAKNSLRAAGKVTGQSSVANRLANTVPLMTGGRSASLTEMMSGVVSSDFTDLAKTAPEVVQIARSFEGVVNTEGIHACGVVVSDESLLGLVPLRRDRKTNSRITEWDGGEIEAANFLKMDVLGLTALDIIASASRLANVDPDELDLHDERAWDLIAKGHTNGLFQLESEGMTDLCRRIGPRSIDDLAAVIALYRPGPLGMGMHILYADRKTGQADVDYGIFTSDPDEQAVIQSTLDETFGVIIYQEQILRLADTVAGFAPHDRDDLLKAVGKKIREQMDRSGELFQKMAVLDVDYAGNPKLAFSASTASHLWDAFKSAGEYSFNKSHATGYAFLSYQMAWLKANYPAEFAAGWLSHTENPDKRSSFLSQLDGVALLCPDVNHSLATPTVHGGNVILGLGGISDVGSVANFIVAEREAHGPFTSLHDIASRVRTNDEKRVSVTALGALVDAGACDAFGPRLGQIMMMGTVKDVEAPVPGYEFDVLERGTRERQRLGILVSESPLQVLGDQLRTWRSPTAGRKPTPVHKVEPGNVTTLGIVASFEIIRKRSRFAKMRLAGTRGTISCLIWERTLNIIEHGMGVPRVGDVVGVDGVIKIVNDTTFDEVEEVDEVSDGGTVSLEMTVNSVWTYPLSAPTWGGFLTIPSGVTESPEEGSRPPEPSHDDALDGFGSDFDHSDDPNTTEPPEFATERPLDAPQTPDAPDAVELLPTATSEHTTATQGLDRADDDDEGWGDFIAPVAPKPAPATPVNPIEPVKPTKTPTTPPATSTTPPRKFGGRGTSMLE